MTSNLWKFNKFGTIEKMWKSGTDLRTEKRRTENEREEQENDFLLKSSSFYNFPW